MNFIYIWDDGRYRSRVLAQSTPWGVTHRLKILYSCIIKIFSFKNLIFIWPDDKYRFKVSLNLNPIQRSDFEVIVTEISYKGQTFCIKVYIGILSRSFE